MADVQGLVVLVQPSRRCMVSIWHVVSAYCAVTGIYQLMAMCDVG